MLDVLLSEMPKSSSRATGETSTQKQQNRQCCDSLLILRRQKQKTQKGQKIVLENMGDMKPGFLPGDIVFLVKEKPHRQFKRRGADLLMEQTITLAEVCFPASLPAYLPAAAQCVPTASCFHV